MSTNGLDLFIAAKAKLDAIKHFLSKSQYEAVLYCFKGEEKEFFFDKVAALATLIAGMPKTYQTDGQGMEVIASLHYFHGGSDWYITEKDMDGDVDQAFGYAILNGDMDCAEFGYISIKELVGFGVELDFHFEPQSVQSILKGN